MTSLAVRFHPKQKISLTTGSRRTPEEGAIAQPRKPPRSIALELLAQAAEEARHAEAYHDLARNPDTLTDAAAERAVRDATAMQLVELAGSVEGFRRNRREPDGTVLDRFDKALIKVFRLRGELSHPERVAQPAVIVPGKLRDLLSELKITAGNLDRESLLSLRPEEQDALKSLFSAIEQIEEDGLAKAGELRPRDLHYAGYYREILFARLGKATGLFDNFGKSTDPRLNEINRAIFKADDFAHRFLNLRSGPRKAILPQSVVAPGLRAGRGNRALSEMIREQREIYQTPAERLQEMEQAATDRARQQYDQAAESLVALYQKMTRTRAAGDLIRKALAQHPQFGSKDLHALTSSLKTAMDAESNYLAQPQEVLDLSIRLGCALDDLGDSRLLGVIEAAEMRAGLQVEALARQLSRLRDPQKNEDPRMLDGDRGVYEGAEGRER
jgi:hypothetical protein